jgi:hypothetical protein
MYLALKVKTSVVDPTFYFDANFGSKYEISAVSVYIVLSFASSVSYYIFDSFIEYFWGKVKFSFTFG